jgi:hypothetical protein
MRKGYFVVESLSHVRRAKWDDEVVLEVITADIDNDSDFNDIVKKRVPSNTQWWYYATSQAAHKKVRELCSEYNGSTSRTTKITLVNTVTGSMLAKIRALKAGDYVTVISFQYTYGRSALIKPGTVIVVNNSNTPYVRQPIGKHTGFLSGYALIDGKEHPCGIDYENVAFWKPKYKESEIAAFVDVPIIDTEAAEDAGDVLLNFYRALGWNGADTLNVRKVRVSETVYNSLLEAMKEKCPDHNGISAAMVNYAPGVDVDMPPNKVFLLKGWITP